MSHYIVEGGTFDLATKALLASGFTIPWGDAAQTGASEGASGGEGGEGKSGKRLKFTCPACGLNAWAKPDARLVCGFDGALMPPSSQQA